MASVSLKKYSSIELDEQKKVGFLVSETFSNAYFNSVNRNSYEDDNSSLWKFIDSHHDNRLVKITEKLLESSLSNDEVKLLDSVFFKFKAFSKKYKMPFSTANAAVFRALFQARIINRLSKINNKKLNVTEIGPGSGWLSIMLYLNDINVFAIENTQSHYCFQSLLFDHFAKNDFAEFATKNNIAFKKINHVPWWKICRPDFSLPKQDIVTSNHMLQECSVWSLTFYISLVSRLLKEDGFWLIEGLGARYQNGPNLKFIKKEIKKYGFNLYNISWSLPRADGIYVISRNKPKLKKLALGKKLELDYFHKTHGNIINDKLLSSSEFLSYANIPH